MLDKHLQVTSIVAPIADRWRQSGAQSPAVVAIIALVLGGIVGTATAFGPVYAVAGLIALVSGYFLLTSTDVGLAMVVAIITLLPFGTLPFKAIITPSFLTLALLGVMLVWIVRLLARSDTYDLRLSPPGLPLLGFLGLTFFSLVLGAGGLPDSLMLHNYVKFVLAILFFFTVVNCIRTRAQARLMLQVLILCGGLAALIGLFLYVLNDQTTLRVLVALGRIGYPTGGRVVRYVEDDPGGLERAIGTSVDPNSFGGMLALVAALAGAQLFAARPVLRQGVLVSIMALLVITILLTFSRAALVGLIVAAMYLATLRYRRLWWVMIGGGLAVAILLIGLGMAEEFAQRLTDGVQFRDQAQQMRLAEYRNAVNIIARYPLFGIGFGAAPDIDLVAGVSSIYLAIAQRLGLLGLAAFLGIMVAWFVHTWQSVRQMDTEQLPWLLGTQAGLAAALAVGLADHYFFNIEFSHMVALFWGCAGLGMAITLLQD